MDKPGYLREDLAKSRKQRIQLLEEKRKIQQSSQKNSQQAQQLGLRVNETAELKQNQSRLKDIEKELEWNKRGIVGNSKELTSDYRQDFARRADNKSRLQKQYNEFYDQDVKSYNNALKHRDWAQEKANEVADQNIFSRIFNPKDNSNYSWPSTKYPNRSETYQDTANILNKQFNNFQNAPQLPIAKTVYPWTKGEINPYPRNQVPYHE